MGFYHFQLFSTFFEKKGIVNSFDQSSKGSFGNEKNQPSGVVFSKGSGY